MPDIIRIFSAKLSKLLESGTERTLYKDFCIFIENIATELKYKEIIATAEENSTQHEDNIGFPDITVRQGDRLVGWIELKLPNDSLTKEKFQKQFKKYEDALENIIFTNLREWQLWQWNSAGKAEKISTLLFDLQDFKIGEDQKLHDLFFKFFEGQAYAARTPKQLALALARKAKFLSQQIEDVLKKSVENSELVKLKKFFEETLVEAIKPHQFANMVAETMAYSLFLAALEHEERDADESLTLTTAIDYLPKNVPILRGMYDLVKNVSNSEKSISHAVNGVLEQLKNSEIGSIKARLEDPKRGRDPVAEYFYEDFLEAYDPEAKKQGGVFYTPKPVVDFIVAATDSLLRKKFSKKEGLADESVSILDPATGTGTFLMSAIQTIYQNITSENGTLGESIVKGKFSKVVRNHILKHFYGFEIMMAPYAMAHLKLSLIIEKYGFRWEETYEDGDTTNDRFQIYLTNTLDDPNQPPRLDMPGLKIAEESNRATKVKNEAPVLAILGNPPYSNFGMMNKQPWILKLLDDYKKNLNEKKINLDDDYIKFIRFAQWKIEKSGSGIFAMITANSFLDGVTHRQMRASILADFDEVYIVNLHGNSRKGETSPDGSKDENVFNIQTGVSINIFVRLPERHEKCVVKYLDLWGRKDAKFEWCNTQVEKSFADTDWFKKNAWCEIDWQKFNADFCATRWSKKLGALNFLVPPAADAGEKMLEYGQFWGVTDIFEQSGSGVKTDRDNLCFDYEKKKLEARMKKAFSEDCERKFVEKYEIKNSSSYKFKDKLTEQSFDNSAIYKCQYRPFDEQFLYYKVGFTSRPGWETMRHMLQPNLGLVTTRLLPDENFKHLFCVNSLIDIHIVSDQNYLFPLYLYPETEKNSTENDETKFLKGGQQIKTRTPNLNPKFIADLENKIDLKFDPDVREMVAREDAENESAKKEGYLKYFGGRWCELMCSVPHGSKSPQIRPSDRYFDAEDVFYYTYAVFHSPAYRARYAEQLKIDFPRLPLTSNSRLFKHLVVNGRQLVNLHLLGKNPFDSSPTIFDDTSKWGVKAEDEAPVGTDDWKVTKVEYDPQKQRVYVNAGQYFDGIEKEVWEFMIGGYQVLEKWLKDRKKAERCLSVDDLKHYMKIVVSLRETRRIMQEIDHLIKKWPME
ncbi:MAG: type ISP restriction/modification enzyme [Patescibacteria group bacterium]